METFLFILAILMIVIAGYRLVYVATFRAMGAYLADQAKHDQEINKYQR